MEIRSWLFYAVLMLTILATSAIEAGANTYKVSFRNIYGKFAVAENGGARKGGTGGVVNTNRDKVGVWEVFTLTDTNGGELTSGDIIHLQSSDGSYLVAEGEGVPTGGGGPNNAVNANRPSAGAWESFRISKVNGAGGVITENELISLQAYNGWNGGGGAFVVGDYNFPNAKLRADRPGVGDWERFTIHFTFDMADFMFNDTASASNILRFNSGGEQPIRAYRATTSFSNGFYVTKSWNTGEFEELWYNNSYIYLVRDTSWQPSNFCHINGVTYETSFELWDTQTATRGGKYMPREVRPVDAAYVIGPYDIKSRFEAGPQKCQLCNNSPTTGANQSRTIKARFLPSKRFDVTGVTLYNLVVIEGVGGPGTGEKYYYHKTLGWVGYEDASGLKSHYSRVEHNNLTIADPCP